MWPIKPLNVKCQETALSLLKNCLKSKIHSNAVFGRFFNVRLFIKLTLSDFFKDRNQGIDSLSLKALPTRGFWGPPPPPERLLNRCLATFRRKLACVLLSGGLSRRVRLILLPNELGCHAVTGVCPLLYFYFEAKM